MISERHALVMPLYGTLPATLPERLEAFQQAGFLVVLVLNNPVGEDLPPTLTSLVSRAKDPRFQVVLNHNLGGVAGGFNRGVEQARAAGAQWVTLLDQDSDLSAAQLQHLRDPWGALPTDRLVVGPRVWDARRRRWHGRWRSAHIANWTPTRLLISSGTTFRSSDWAELGLMQEWLVVDFVDHAWSFQAQARGFHLLQHNGVVLNQYFGARHPNHLCHLLGMEFYPARRHFYCLRNLRWLLRRPEVPWDLKAKEMLKMLFKPWLWLLLEPERGANLRAVVQALLAPIPAPESE